MEGKEALAALAFLKVKIRNRSVANQIAKALQSAADKAGVTPEELEEMSVPEYGMTGIGLLEVPLGEFTARLSVEGTNKTSLDWLKKDGTEQKSIPAAIKADFAEELNGIRASAKEIQKMLPALRERIDSSYLLEKSWLYSVWLERYRDHPLTGTLARRLIWRFANGGETKDLIFHNGAYHDSKGDTHELPVEESVQVSLWHPLAGEPDEALAWRRWLEDNSPSNRHIARFTS